MTGIDESLDSYFASEDRIHEHFGYRPGWNDAPLEDGRARAWAEWDGNVYWSNTREGLEYGLWRDGAIDVNETKHNLFDGFSESDEEPSYHMESGEIIRRTDFVLVIVESDRPAPIVFSVSLELVVGP